MQRFEDDVDSVFKDTCDMADLAADLLKRAVRAIVDGDVGMAESVIADQRRIDSYDDSIEESAIRILTIYQPTAVDTRTVATILKSITQLERIAKYSTNIANATKYLSDKPSFEVVDLITPVGDTAMRLVDLVIGGFKDRSVEGFPRITEIDDSLDDAMVVSISRVVEFINTHENSADVCTYYISVLKFLERVVPHACKMAEKVCFMVTGKRATIR